LGLEGFGAASESRPPARPAPSSTAIGSLGAYVVVVATTMPDHVLGVTSCYLGNPDGPIAASHLRLGPERSEHVRTRVLEPPRHIDDHARACLLDHAYELHHALAELTETDVSVEINPDALRRAAPRKNGPRSSEPRSQRIQPPAVLPLEHTLTPRSRDPSRCAGLEPWAAPR
jgi:hypothetical protein